jgi:hypothetical protein
MAKRCWTSSHSHLPSMFRQQPATREAVLSRKVCTSAQDSGQICTSQDAVGAFGTGIWVGKRSLQDRRSAGNGPQNDANFSHSILECTVNRRLKTLRFPAVQLPKNFKFKGSSHGMRNEMHFRLKGASQARSMLALCTNKASEIPLPSGSRKVRKDAFKPNY